MHRCIDRQSRSDGDADPKTRSHVYGGDGRSRIQTEMVLTRSTTLAWFSSAQRPMSLVTRSSTALFGTNT